MDRRTFLATGTLSALSLSGCGGGGSSVSPTPPPAASRFATGWTQMPPEDYQNIPEAGNGNFTIVDSIDNMDLSDPELLSRMGQPTLLPQPDPIGQGRQPSCTAWAVGFAAATATMRYAGANLPAPISPADLFAKILRRSPNACSNGSTISAAMDTLVQEGVVTLAEAPYSDLQCGIPSAAPPFQLDGFSRVPAADSISIRGSIQMLQPVSFGMLVDDRFQSLNPSNSIYVPSGTGGGHATTIIGYDNATQRYKVMNSWGRAWGQGGMYWISYADFARFANDVCIPYLRRASDNELLAKGTSNQASPITAQFMKGRAYGSGTPGSYGVGAEMGWSSPLEIRTAYLAILDGSQSVIYSQNFTVQQISRGIRFGMRVPDALAHYTYLESSISGFDSSGAPLALSTLTKPYQR